MNYGDVRECEVHDDELEGCYVARERPDYEAVAVSGLVCGVVVLACCEGFADGV